MTGFQTCALPIYFIYVDFKSNCQELYFKLLPYGVMIRGDFSDARISIGTHVQNETLVRAIADLNEKGQL